MSASKQNDIPSLLWFSARPWPVEKVFVRLLTLMLNSLYLTTAILQVGYTHILILCHQFWWLQIVNDRAFFLFTFITEIMASLYLQKH